MLDHINKIDELSSNLVSVYRNKLANRMREILNEIEIDENRILQEAAILADRSDITEEIVRLRSHISDNLTQRRIHQRDQTYSCQAPRSL